jgi:dynein light intermediate chain, axonemal
VGCLCCTLQQVTINCAERGLLLLRVRDEIHMTVAAYQTLYESSIAFGMRKALIAEQRKAEMQARDSPLLLFIIIYQVFVAFQNSVL